MAEKLLNKSLSDLLNDKSLLNKVDILQTNGTNKNLIDISLIKPNPFQPRKNFDDKSLDELAQSIEEFGVFSPILLRPREGYYEIVAGERRYRASIRANKKDIPAIIENFTDQEMAEIALLENIQRENLNPLEIAQSLYDYQVNFKCTQEELSQRFNKSRPYIANLLRLRQLPKSVQNEIIAGNITAGHAKPLVGLSDEKAEEYLKIIKQKNLNVRETEALVGMSNLKKTKSAEKVKDREESIGKKLKAKVKLTKNEIKISFSTKEELEEYLKKLS